MPKNAHFFGKICKIAAVLIHLSLASVRLLPLTDIVLLIVFLALNVFCYFKK